MPSANTFRDVLAWQKAHELALLIYQKTALFPADERCSLVNQMRRCAVSVPSNIAEGFRRNGKKDKLRFYNLAESSLEELKYQLLLSKDLGYLIESEFHSISELANSCGYLLSRWMHGHR